MMMTAETTVMKTKTTVPSIRVHRTNTDAKTDDAYSIPGAVIMKTV